MSQTLDFAITPTIKGILILDNNGKRIAAKYYTDDLSDIKKQMAFEANLFQKTSRLNARMDAQIMLIDKFLAVFKFNTDAHFYVLSGSDENELIVLSVLTALEETMGNLLRNQIDKRTLIENLDLLLLAIDEIVDDGLILETDSAMVTSRVQMKGAEKDVPLSEQTLSQAFQTAKQALSGSFK
jgi:hypothetical protein